MSQQPTLKEYVRRLNPNDLAYREFEKLTKEPDEQPHLKVRLKKKVTNNERRTANRKITRTTSR